MPGGKGRKSHSVHTQYDLPKPRTLVPGSNAAKFVVSVGACTGLSTSSACVDFAHGALTNSPTRAVLLHRCTCARIRTAQLVPLPPPSWETGPYHRTSKVQLCFPQLLACPKKGRFAPKAGQFVKMSALLVCLVPHATK